MKKALIKFKKFVLEQCSNIDEAYRKLFSEFDTNMDSVLSREEFLLGLDKYNKYIKLSERQKIRLMDIADKDKSNSIDFGEFSKLLDDIDVTETEKKKFKISDL